MKMKTFIAMMQKYFALWFHKRNIIIVSERKVKHIPVSGGLQFIVLSFLVSSVCWASYSTGCFIAARSVLDKQTQALKSIASTRVDSNFSAVLPAPSAPVEPPHDATADNTPSNMMLSLPSSLDNIRLYARVAYLEKQVTDLQAANESIVKKVRDKASGKIVELESLIRQTGLNPEEMKKSASENHPKPAHHHATEQGEGGPFIPAEPIDSVHGADEMFSNLDDLALLNQIVKNLPLTSPIKGGEEESPFGRRVDPINGHLAFHPGLDLAGPVGTEVHSTAAGKVISAGRAGAYGNAIDIDHGSGVVTRYGHLSEILVQQGQTVNKGEVIGVQGSTGRSTGPHVHYEVRYHDQPLNPKNFLSAGQYVSQE